MQPVSKVSLKFIRNNAGVAAMEFALIFPIFIVAFYGVAETANYNLMSRRAQQSVDFAAEYISRGGDNITHGHEIAIAEDLWQIVNRTSFGNTGGDAYRNSRGKYTRSFAAIEFDPRDTNCYGASCEYDPVVLWTFQASQGIRDPKRRSCNQTLVPNSAQLDERKLPIGVAGRSAIIVADFTYRYVPLIENGFFRDKEKHITAIRKSRNSNGQQTDGRSGHWVYC